MKVVRIILVVVALGLLAGGVNFVLNPPPGPSIARWVPAGMMFLFGGLTFIVWIPMISGLDHSSLLRNGTPATATIVSVDDTSGTVNHQPVFQFTLDVHYPDGSTQRATTRQVVSRASLGTIQPGISVAVRFDPKKPDRVAIDSSQPATMSSPVAGMASGTSANVMKAADIVKDGVKGSATVQSLSLTGATFGAMAPAQADAATIDDPMVMLSLQVSASDGTAFASQGIHRVPNEMLSRLSPGASIPIAYLARDPAGSTAIDWDRL